MPIKFRCEHCQQLLGISRSRAAATVDCPQCGRSLKVPGTAGDAIAEGVQSASSKNTGHPDSDLMSALNELTMLGGADDDWGSPSTAPSDGARPFDDSDVIIQGKDVPEERSRQDLAVESVVIGDDSIKALAADSALGHIDLPVTSAEALQDLASWADSESILPVGSPPSQIATDLLTEMRQASHPSSWLATSIAAILLVGMSGATGWWLAKSESLEVWLGTDGAQRQAAVENVNLQQAQVAVHVPAAIRFDPTQWVITVTGQVQYLDGSGQGVPDGRATVYLLPSSRQGNLKVHARSFQQEPSDADRRFSEAALQALGGLRVEADGEGRFQIGTHAKSDQYQLVVVSSHQERAENMLPDSSITTALMPWFDSTVHVLGKRNSVLKLLSGSVSDLRIVVPN